jgi:hypothetical protein
METDTSLDVPDRTHIMPMGFEEERIIRPAKRFRADEVVIIRHDDESEEFDSHFEVVEKELETMGTELEMVSCDIFDVYDSLRVISEAISSHSGDDLYMNLSTGSKITAIAGMIACMCSDTEPYYARASNYSESSPSEVTKIMSLPKYNIDPPTSGQVAILSYLRNLGPSTKKTLIKFGEDSNLDFLADFEGKEKGKYRRLDTQIITPLSKSDYINVRQDGRKKVVEITESGKDAQMAFEHLIKVDTEDNERSQSSIDSYSDI